jgi:hypothetical protein
MGFVHVMATVRIPGTREDSYEALFLVDSGAIDWRTRR